MVHKVYFCALYDGCHVLFLVYFHCNMGDNKGGRLAASHIVLYESALRSAYLFSHWFD